MNEVSVIKEGWLHKRGKGSLFSADRASLSYILLSQHRVPHAALWPQLGTLSEST